MRRVFVCALTAVACSAPAEPEHDGKVPGTLLGTFAVQGAIRSDDCGADLLGAPDPWRFEVRLSRFQRDLYWLNGREAIVGEIDEDDATFRFSTRVDIPIGGRRDAAMCVVSRYDRAEGSLSLEGDELLGFEGRLEFEYRSKDDSECLEIIVLPGSVNNLPCRIAYRIRAVRADDVRP